MNKPMMRFLAATALWAATFGAQATLLTLADFNGTESLIDFNAATPGSFAGSYSTPGITLTPESGSYMIQPGGGSAILDTSGAAFNTRSESGNGDVTILFDAAISRFGVNFGTAAELGPLSAVVTAFDAADNIVETASFPSFGNAFVGFDFASAVTRVLINRTDTSDLFTFVDDVRFVNATVPEPATVALLAIAAIAAVGTRRRRNR